jgi:galactokinase
LVVIESGIKHEHASGEYRVRRAECEQACTELGVASLRELTSADEPRIDQLPDTLRRRVRHVVTENARVLSAVAALKTGNLVRLGAVLYASHESLRDDYEVTTPELDYIVAAAQSERDVVGARMTGGGFGGSVLIVTTNGAAEDVGESVADRYAARFPHAPSVILP